MPVDTKDDLVKSLNDAADRAKRVRDAAKASTIPGAVNLVPIAERLNVESPKRPSPQGEK